MQINTTITTRRNDAASLIVHQHKRTIILALTGDQREFPEGFLAGMLKRQAAKFHFMAVDELRQCGEELDILFRETTEPRELLGGAFAGVVVGHDTASVAVVGDIRVAQVLGRRVVEATHLHVFAEERDSRYIPAEVNPRAMPTAMSRWLGSGRQVDTYEWSLMPGSELRLMCSEAHQGRDAATSLLQDWDQGLTIHVRCSK